VTSFRKWLCCRINAGTVWQKWSVTNLPKGKVTDFFCISAYFCIFYDFLTPNAAKGHRTVDKNIRNSTPQNSELQECKY